MVSYQVFDWQSSGDVLASSVVIHWQYGGLPIGGVTAKWHPIGSQVALEWLGGTS